MLPEPFFFFFSFVLQGNSKEYFGLEEKRRRFFGIKEEKKTLLPARLELATFASGRHQFEPKRDVTTRRDPPLSFFGEICVDSQRVESRRSMREEP